MDTAEVIGLVLLLLSCGAGMLLTVLQFPGNWLIVVGHVIFAWYFEWAITGWKACLALVGIAAVTELVEMLVAAWFTRRGGGSRKAAWWSLVGGVLGAFCLSVPVPIVGTVIGAAAGCFIGALIAEMSLERTAIAATSVGIWSATGRTLATVIKMTASVILAGLSTSFAVYGLWQ